MCLICHATLTNDSMRPSKLRKHLETIHQDKMDKPLIYFQNLRENFHNRNTIDNIVARNTVKTEAGFLASYQISQLIAEAGKPHTIGESLIIPAVSVVISTVMKQKAIEITKCIPLSNSTVSRRIDEMAGNMEMQLVSELQVMEFALQIDESTMHDNEALLPTYVRFIDGVQRREEMLFARFRDTDTKGESIFHVVKADFMEKNIPLSKITACATDGAAPMVARYRGFIAHLKLGVPSLFCIHCVVHRQHLVSKNWGAA